MAATIVDMQYFFFLILFFFSALILLPFLIKGPKTPQGKARLPPSPRAIPLIGHLHLLDLSVPFHKTLQKISSRYGPLINLRVLNFHAVLVSSASGAYDVYKTQDVNFSSRFSFSVHNSIVFSSSGFGLAPYGDYWKSMKKLTMTELLGHQHMERSRTVRREEFDTFYAELLEKAKKAEIVDVGEEVMKLSHNVIRRMVMGRKYSSDKSDEAEEVTRMVRKAFDTARKIIIGKAFRPFNSLFEKEATELSRRFDVLLEKIITEREQNPEPEHRDIMDLLLEAYHDQNAQLKITRDQLKAFVVDMFMGGTDTSMKVVQWTMSELMNNRDSLGKLREEIDNAIPRTRLIRETDLSNLPYLEAVVKEGLRLHPPVPIMARECLRGCEIGGFDVPRNTSVILNLYAIMRDPESWEDPDEFRPERFMEEEEDKDKERTREMKYLPFGGGRRGCPGTNLAHVLTRMSIGIMVQCFDWEIEGREVNLKETGNLLLTMAHPIKCFPLLRFNDGSDMISSI